MSSAPNLEGILLLEQPFCKVTHDQLKRQLRFQQRLIERDLSGCNQIINNLKSIHESKPKSQKIHHHADPVGQTKRKFNSEAEDGDGDGDAGDESLDVDLSLNVDNSIAEMSVDQGNQSFGSSRQRLVTDSQSKNQSHAQLEKNLDGMIGKLRGLKRKLSPLPNSMNSTLEATRSRYDHLSELHSIKSTNSKDFEQWSKIRLDRFMSDWMLRRGFKESAASIAIEGWEDQDRFGKGKGIQNLIDLDLFNELNAIEDSLVPNGNIGPGDKERKNSCTLALNWCGENKSSLKKIRDSTIEFDLRLQEFIELNRTRTPESLKEAIIYARKHLLPLLSQSTSISKAELTKENVNTEGSNPTIVSRSSGDTSIGIRAINRDLSRNNPSLISMSNPSSQIKNEVPISPSLSKEQEQEIAQQEKIKSQVLRSMGLLASGPNNWSYQDLYNQDRWLVLKENFRKVFFELHSLPLSSSLHISLSAGLSSLKVPACYVKDDEETANDRGKGKEEEKKKEQKASDDDAAALDDIHRSTDSSANLPSELLNNPSETWYAVRASDGTVQLSRTRNEIPGDEMTSRRVNISSADAVRNLFSAANAELDQMNENNVTSTTETVANNDGNETGNVSHGTPNSLPNTLTLNSNNSILNINSSPSNPESNPPSHSHSHSPSYLRSSAKASTSSSSQGNAPIYKKLNPSKSIDCPICDSNGLGLLAKEVPWSHHENSTLVCWISGKLMNEENPPMCLPNGRAYSRSALEEMAMKSKDGSTIVCPRTGGEYKFSELRKVYIS